MMFPIYKLPCLQCKLPCVFTDNKDQSLAITVENTRRNCALGPRLSMDHKSLPIVVCLLLTQLLSLVGWGFESVKGSSM